MSINQISEFLTPGLRIPNPQTSQSYIYCLIYEHSNPMEFIRYMPPAVILGLGTLSGWVFHVNEKGNPNIRVSYMNGNFASIPGSHCVLPAPASHFVPIPPTGHQTYGWVYQIPSMYDAAVHALLSTGQRIRIVTRASITTSRFPPRMANASVITYWDPRHTRDLHDNILKVRQVEDYWKDGILRMRNAGMPMSVAMKMWRHLHGIVEDVEPLLLRPTLLPGVHARDTGVEMDYRVNEHLEYNPKLPINTTPARSRSQSPSFDTEEEMEPDSIPSPAANRKKPRNGQVAAGGTLKTGNANSKKKKPLLKPALSSAGGGSSKAGAASKKRGAESIAGGEESGGPKNKKRRMESTAEGRGGEGPKRQRKSSARVQEILDDANEDPEWEPPMRWVGSMK